MRYTYAYKTSDGQRHEAILEAASREAVFAELRKEGIRAIKVVAADGSKENGEIVVKGVRRRVVTVGALCLVLCALCGIVAAFWLGRGGSTSRPPRGDESGGLIEAALPFLTDTTRRQVIGDAAVIEKGIRTGWADVFDREGDRFLASFAIPGVKAGVGTVSVAALEEALGLKKVEKIGGGGGEDEGEGGHRKVGSSPTGRARTPSAPQNKGQTSTVHLLSPPTFSSSLEARQIIAMVNGMKAEARAYLAAGGTLAEYGRRLTERQDAEIAIYKRAESEILAAYAEYKKNQPIDNFSLLTSHSSLSADSSFSRLYEQRNDELRNLGIRPITLPE